MSLTDLAGATMHAVKILARTDNLNGSLILMTRLVSKCHERDEVLIDYIIP
jgi:hypothetical protein